MMDNRHHDIDQLFQQGLDGFEPTPSPEVWQGVSRVLSWKEFVKLDFSNFTHNVYLMVGSAAALVGITAASLLIWNDSNIPAPVKNPLTISDSNTHNTPIVTPSVSYPEPTVKPSTQSIAAKKILSEGSDRQKPTSPQIKLADAPKAPEPVISKLTPLPTGPISSDDSVKADFLTRTWDKIAGMDGFYRHPGKFSVGVGAGFDRFVQPMGDKMEDAITNSNSYNLKLRYDNYGFQIETGLMLNSWEDKGSYKANFREWDTVYSYIRVEYYVPDPSNPDSVVLITETIHVFDSVAKEATWASANKYTYLTIPLQFGYKLAEYGRFGFTAWVGGAVSFETSRTIGAPAIPTGLRTNKITLADMTRERKTQLFMYSAGLRFDIMLSKRIQLEIEPYYRAYRSSVYTTGSPERPHSMGINGGLSIKF